MSKLKTFVGSPVISGIPQCHYGSYLSNFEQKYGTKHQEFYDKLVTLTDRFLQMKVSEIPRYIFLCGSPGSGKTHFMVGLYRAMVHKLGYIHGDGVLFTTGINLAQDMISLFKENIPLRIGLQGYTQSRWLFLDDFSASERVFKEDSLEHQMLRDVLIDRYECRKCLITSSNLNAEDLFSMHLNRMYGGYILSRLSDSLVIQFPDVDFRRIDGKVS